VGLGSLEVDETNSGLSANFLTFYGILNFDEESSFWRN